MGPNDIWMSNTRGEKQTQICSFTTEKKIEALAICTVSVLSTGEELYCNIYRLITWHSLFFVITSAPGLSDAHTYTPDL